MRVKGYQMASRRLTLPAFALTLALVVADRVHAAIDLTGDWSVTTFIGGGTVPFVLPIEIVQTGTGLDLFFGGSPTPTYTGTIDPDSGVFSFSGVTCGAFLDSFTGTAAANGNSFIVTGDTYADVGYCVLVSVELLGSRLPCSDGALDPGEACDDGNGVPGDCCSPGCEFEPPGSPCSDGDALTCEGCAAGLCQQIPCPTVLDHYQCYMGTDLKNPKFIKQPADTADQLTNEVVAVKRLQFVCAPVDKNGEGINDPAAHLACYRVKGAELAALPRVELSTQFQISRLELKKPKLLCAPATKTLLP
jgi:cysteine-rich repeat protein